MEIDGFGVFKAFGGKFYKGRIFEEFMTLTERLDAFIEKNIVSINIYGSDALIVIGTALTLSAGYVGEFSSEMNLGMYTAVGGVCLRIGAGHIKRISEGTERLREKLTEVKFQGIASRDGFYEA